MCGIFSILNVSVDAKNRLHELGIELAFEEGKYRGPEYNTLQYVQENAIFGFHRLAINGLDEISNQPLTNNRHNVILICNGEIYNFRELIEKFEINTNTNSDCEVILHLYEKVGIEQTLQLLDGVFAFILMDLRDANKPVCHVARDPLGVRPLFMLSGIERINNLPVIAFASEIKMLTPLRDTLLHINRFNLSDNYKIDSFLPGTYRSFNSVHINKIQHIWREVYNERYFSLSFSPVDYNYYFNNVTGNNSEEYVNANHTLYISQCKTSIRNTLIQAVKKRVLTTDRPIACLLSGGLDSSLITSIVLSIYKQRPDYKNLPPLETYSIGMNESEDSRYAEKVAKFLGTKHTTIELSEQDFLDAIPEVIYKIESFDTTTVRASVGNYLVAKYIKEHSEAKVIFNGDGSDELTGGYLYMHHAENAHIFDGECRRLLKDIHYFDVLRSDRSISTNGLEPRTPFLDKRFVQTYLSIDENLRFVGTKIFVDGSNKLPFKEQIKEMYPFNECNRPCEKWLLRTSFDTLDPITMQPYLPKEILWRTKEAFSDGVSSNNRSWFEIIQQHLDCNNYEVRKNSSSTTWIEERCYIRQLNTDNRDGYLIMYSLKKEFEKYLQEWENERKYGNNIKSHMQSRTLEQFFYRKVFEYFFGYENEFIIPYFWMPKFIQAKDCSARSLNIYKEAQF